MGVVMVEEPIDGGLQIGHRSEDAAFELSLRQGGEEALSPKFCEPARVG